MGLTNGRGARHEEAFAEHRFSTRTTCRTRNWPCRIPASSRLPRPHWQCLRTRKPQLLSPWRSPAARSLGAQCMAISQSPPLHGDSSMPLSPRRRGAAGATALGRTAVVVSFALAVDVLFLGWRGSSLFRLAFTRSNSAILDILSAIFYAMNLMYLLQIALTFGGSLLA